jgi:hypothetical protein
LGVARAGRTAQEITGAGIVVITGLRAVAIAKLTIIDDGISTGRLTLPVIADLRAATLSTHFTADLTAHSSQVFAGIFAGRRVTLSRRICCRCDAANEHGAQSTSQESTKEYSRLDHSLASKLNENLPECGPALV